MSHLIEFETACPSCKYPNRAEVWSIVNVKEDPELKDILLGGELNMAQCASCKMVFFAEHFLIYHESDRELMAFVYPNDKREQADLWREKTQTDFTLSQATLPDADQFTYKPVTLFGLDELLRLVEKEEERSIQGDIVQALAPDHVFEVKKLSFARARELDLPAVLPLLRAGASSEREQILQGLEALLSVNEHLFVYSELRTRLLADPNACVA